MCEMLRDTCHCGEPATIPPDYCEICYKAHREGFKKMIALAELENQAIEILNERAIREAMQDAV